MRLRRRHRLLALLALFGLLFQQVAMAGYACPLERTAPAATTEASTPPCHQAGAPDKSRCHEHCHPLQSSLDHGSAPSVPAALLPPTTWLRVDVARRDVAPLAYREIAYRATSPPLNIQHCTFQI